MYGCGSIPRAQPEIQKGYIYTYLAREDILHQLSKYISFGQISITECKSGLSHRATASKAHDRTQLLSPRSGQTSLPLLTNRRAW